MLFRMCAERLNVTEEDLMARIVGSYGFKNENEIIRQNLMRWYTQRILPDYVVNYCHQVLGRPKATPKENL